MTTFLAQLTDLHIREPGRLTYRRIDTAQYLELTVQSVLALPQRPHAVVIDRGVTGFALRYQNAKLGVAHWQPQWGPEKDNEKELPSAVQIELQSASGVWPMMVVAMRTVHRLVHRAVQPAFAGRDAAPGHGARGT